MWHAGHDFPKCTTIGVANLTGNGWQVVGTEAGGFSCAFDRTEGRLIRGFAIRAITDDGFVSRRSDLHDVSSGDLRGHGK